MVGWMQPAEEAAAASACKLMLSQACRAVAVSVGPLWAAAAAALQSMHYMTLLLIL
jgi:hypothetical protein